MSFYGRGVFWGSSRRNRVLSEVLTDTREFDRNYLRQDLGRRRSEEFRLFCNCELRCCARGKVQLKASEHRWNDPGRNGVGAKTKTYGIAIWPRPAYVFAPRVLRSLRAEDLCRCVWNGSCGGELREVLLHILVWRQTVTNRASEESHLEEALVVTAEGVSYDSESRQVAFNLCNGFYLATRRNWHKPTSPRKCAHKGKLSNHRVQPNIALMVTDDDDYH